MDAGFLLRPVQDSRPRTGLARSLNLSWATDLWRGGGVHPDRVPRDAHFSWRLPSAAWVGEIDAALDSWGAVLAFFVAGVEPDVEVVRAVLSLAPRRRFQPLHHARRSFHGNRRSWK